MFRTTVRMSSDLATLLRSRDGQAGKSRRFVEVACKRRASIFDTESACAGRKMLVIDKNVQEKYVLCNEAQNVVEENGAVHTHTHTHQIY